MSHDGDMADGNTCSGSAGYIMSALLGIGSVSNMYIWSNCSAEELRMFRVHNKSYCLHDDMEQMMPKILPGFIYDLNYQCVSRYGSDYSADLCSEHNNVILNTFKLQI